MPLTSDQAAGYKTQALGKGISQSYIDDFLSRNPGDEARLESSYGNTPGGAAPTEAPAAAGGASGSYVGLMGATTPPAGAAQPAATAPAMVSGINTASAGGGEGEMGMTFPTSPEGMSLRGLSTRAMPMDPLVLGRKAY